MTKKKKKKNIKKQAKQQSLSLPNKTGKNARKLYIDKN